jgi:hypothetical protein
VPSARLAANTRPSIWYEGCEALALRRDIRAGQKILWNQTSLDPPENDGRAPQWNTARTQIAI